jgi:hypothetical protein
MNLLAYGNILPKNLFLNRSFYLLVILFILNLISCTNYTVSRTQTIPPILISISNREGGGHLLVFRGANPEIFFTGYKLYVGSNTNEVRNPSNLSSGIDCENRTIIPNLPLEYSIEINPNSTTLSQVNTGENGNRVCRFPSTLNSGQVISVRSLLLSIQPGAQSFQYSTPSNSLVVP